MTRMLLKWQINVQQGVVSMMDEIDTCTITKMPPRDWLSMEEDNKIMMSMIGTSHLITI